MFATTLTTERLTLRSPRLDDAEAIFRRYASDPEVTRFLSWPPHTRVQDTRDFLAERLEKTAERGETRWVICLRDDPLPWGMITARSRGQEVDLGYYLARSLWGQGIMTEATRAVLSEAWCNQSVMRVTASCHVDNTGSACVLEKCGFTRERSTRCVHPTPQSPDEPQECFQYALERERPWRDEAVAG